ncbi:peptidyl-tRNA hydrolase domain-containing protein 1 [Conglomerata obtusa]
MKLKQIILLRSDLKEFSKGALAAQAIHASIKAINQYFTDAATQEYLLDIDHMTTVILKTNNEGIRIIVEFLTNRYDFVEWVEQPENLLTAIALKPCIIDETLDKFLRRFKLY